MKILQIIDNKSTYHKDIENILKTLSDLNITTYSIDNNDIYEYEKINNTFDYIFIYAFPKTNKKYYQFIEQYLTPKKILFIDFISDISLFENISFDHIQKLIKFTEKTFIFNEKIYNKLSKENDKCIKLNHFMYFDNMNNFIDYENKNNKDFLVSTYNIDDMFNEYNLYKEKSQIDIINEHKNITYINKNDINKMFMFYYDNYILSKELFNTVYNGVIPVISQTNANKLYITKTQKISDTRYCVIYNSADDFIIQYNKLLKDKNTYNIMRTNTFNVFKQISINEVKKILIQLS